MVLSNMAYTLESMVDSTGLNYCQVGIDGGFVTKEYQDIADHLVFVQAAVQIRSSSQKLLANNLALSTTGTSDGQRVAGAISTATSRTPITGVSAFRSTIAGRKNLLDDARCFVTACLMVWALTCNSSLS